MHRFALILALLTTGCTGAATTAPPARKVAGVRAAVAVEKNGWADRRPIATLMQADNARRSPDNPYGWWPEFKDDPETAMRRCADRVQRYGCQAVHFYDAEGQKYTHPV